MPKNVVYYQAMFVHTKPNCADYLQYTEYIVASYKI